MRDYNAGKIEEKKSSAENQPAFQETAFAETEKSTLHEKVASSYKHSLASSLNKLTDLAASTIDALGNDKAHSARGEVTPKNSSAEKNKGKTVKDFMKRR